MNKSEVKQFQRAMRETVAPDIIVDGAWGAGTNKALAEFAKVNGIDSGEAMRLLERYAETRYVNDDAFAQAAKMLGVKESYVRAIAEVESAGASFLKDGRVKILFERHKFYKYLKEALKKPEVRKHVAQHLGIPEPTGVGAGDSLLILIAAKYENICSSKRGGYKGNEAEWGRLNLAMDLDVEAAAMSASYGGYQLMGFNYHYCGYKTAKEMMIDLAKSESKQFLAAITFIKNNPHIHNALKKGDWAKFAEGYNGPSYKENQYDVKLSKAEVKHRGENALA